MNISLCEYNSTDLILFRFPFNPNITRKIKTLPGPQWYPALAGWGVLWSPLAAWLTLRLFPDSTEYEGTTYEELQPDTTPLELPLPDHLHPFQRAGSLWMQQGNCILHDCPGAGKTRQAIAAASLPVLIVCPVSVVYDWQEEIKVLFPERTSQVVRGKNTEIQDVDYVIVSPHMMKNRHKELLNYETLIIDEIHEYRNPEAQCTRALLALATRIPNVLGVSGTLVINRIADLFPALVAVKKIHHAHYWHFLQRYCGGKKTKRGIKADSLTYEEELREFIQPFILRRTREDLGRTLPPITRKAVTVELSNVEEVNTEKKEVVEWLRINQTAAPPETRMIKLNRLRRLGAIGKVPLVVQYAKALLYKGEKVVIACSFLEPLRRIQASIGPSVRIDGGVSKAKRKELVRAFQESTTPLVALCSMKAGGVGITLTSARHELIMDLPWAPAHLEQMEARVYRETQTRESIITYFLGDGTTDPAMLAVLRKKARWCDRLFKGGDDVFLDILLENENLLLGQNCTTASANYAHDVDLTALESGFSMTGNSGSAGNASVAARQL